MGRDARIRLVVSNQLPDDTREQLQAFADAVEDEAHWQRLLGTATTDEAREELERVVAPMLRFRKARCHTPACDSGQLPIWQPVLVVRKRPEDPPMWAPIEVRYCDRCKDDMTVRDLLTGDIWSQIVRQCVAAGDPVPVRLLTGLLFDRLQ